MIKGSFVYKAVWHGAGHSCSISVLSFITTSNYTVFIVILQQFQTNLKKVNGDRDFDQDMLEEIFNAIHKEEIVLPEERTGAVKEVYSWKVCFIPSPSPAIKILHTVAEVR